MKLNRFFFSAAVMGGLILSSCSESPKTNETAVAPTTTSAWDGTLNVAVDHAASLVNWKGQMIGGLYGHRGLVDLSQSSLVLTNGKVSEGSFTIDMSSIRATDDNYNPADGKTPEKLKGHLISPDFFDIEKHPTATFVITSVEGNKAKGNLTVRGVTNEEVIENIVVTPEGDNVKVTGKLAFDRQKYGVAYATGSKDVILSDEIALEIELAGKKS